MEMAAIEGRMAALLVTQHLRARAAAAQQPAAVQQQHGGVLAQPGGAEPGVAAAA